MLQEIHSNTEPAETLILSYQAFQHSYGMFSAGSIVSVLDGDSKFKYNHCHLKLTDCVSLSPAVPIHQLTL